MNKLRALQQKSMILILAYAPTGLGHLRVTNALYDGLPESANPILLGSHDQTVSIIHRVMSIHPALRNIAEWGQRGMPEDLFTYAYRKVLRGQTKVIYEQLSTILEQRVEIPKKVVMVSTHYGLAHQLAAIKQKLAVEKNVQLVLVVVVTDDSPQHLWYVPEADLTFVPSEQTQIKLLEYGKKSGLKKVNITVAPYPISPNLAKLLSEEKYKDRLSQTTIESENKINIVIPVSGAAVGLDYFAQLIDQLHLVSDRFNFHVVSKDAAYTHNFLYQMMTRNYVHTHVSQHDREIVDVYERIYHEQVISFEVTKPSEQAFKALLTPKQAGGAMLLFSSPVGRQEYDNLDFLRRHHLIPLKNEQKYLLTKTSSDDVLDDLRGKKLMQSAVNWRGIRIPDDPTVAVKFIWWCIKNKLFKQMMSCRAVAQDHDLCKHELGSEGVGIIWEKVTEYLNKDSSHQS